MPIKTQTRLLTPSFDQNWVFRKYGQINQSGTNLGLVPCVQTTTSFRSSRDELNQVKEETKLTRNGFTTYPPKFDTGHEFDTQKQSIELSHKRVTISRPGTDFSYTGPLYVGSRDQGFESIPKMSQNDINRFGTTAIKHTRPLQSQSSLATLIGELKIDGLPRLLAKTPSRRDLDKWFTQKPSGPTVTGGLGTVGDAYLGFQFGYLPFVTEILDMMKAVINVQKTLSQVQRDNGKIVRRSFRFAPTASTTASSTAVLTVMGGSQANNDLVVSGAIGMGTGSLMTTSYERMSFTGAYSYWLPPQSEGLVSKLVDYESRANVVLGTRLTPEVLWELAPWSWLGDWFANVGDILSNASALSADNLVIRYGYLQRHTVKTRTLAIKDVNFYQAGKLGTISTTYLTERKERYRATPFGFGVDMSALSPARWAILAALGMTRSDKTLRLVS